MSLKVLLSVASLAPSYGGPARSVSRLAAGLAQAGLEVGLWAPDDSAQHSPLTASLPEVTKLGGPLKQALAAFGLPQVIHDNGLWLPHHQALARLAQQRQIPRLVSTRGMLEPWARQHKRWKKQLAWWLYQQRHLRQAQCHHVTAEQERGNLRQLKLNVPTCCLPNGIDLPALSQLTQTDSPHDSGAPRIALFVGRLYPVKGLPMLIEAWSTVRPPGWTLEIVGPDEGGHLATLQHQVAEAGLQREIGFLGELEGPALQAAFQRAALFVQPSHSENFGMAIGEALAYGLPVLTTQGTPWPQIPQQGCGWWVPATAAALTPALQEATQLPSPTLHEMGCRSRQLVESGFSWERLSHQMAECYRWLIGQASQPAWVE